jgi:DNA repair protein RecN (Recombination protein N)
MLRRLTIKDFVIVPALDLEFGTGFSVLTGETGAGKSILIDALQLALGGRADAGVVREGATRAEISAEFSISTRVSALTGAPGTTRARPVPGTEAMWLRTVVGAARAGTHGASAR